MTEPSKKGPAIEGNPLPGQQFQSFLWIFHVLFVAGIGLGWVLAWRRGDYEPEGRLAVLAVLGAIQVGLYLRFLVWPGPWVSSWSWWAFYFITGFITWMVEWRLEPTFEWLVWAYVGQLYGVLPPRVSVPTGFAVFGLYFFSRPDWQEWTRGGGLLVYGFITGAVAFTAIGLLLHRLVNTSSERASLINDLRRAQAELEAAHQRDAELAVLRERERLARDLHDSLGHTLVTLAVQMEAVQRLIPVDAPRAATLLEEMKQLTRSSMDALRRSLANLRAPGLGDRPLIQAMRGLAEDVSKRTGLQIRFEVPAEADAFNRTLAEVIWRVYHEALCNIEQHAQARRVHLLLERSDSNVRIVIADDGVGLPPAADQKPGHFGLRGIRERIEGLGGSLRLGASDLRGAHIEAILPYLG
jgi:signal transduction histidine kinase